MSLIPSFSQVSTWRGLLGLASIFGVVLSPELKEAIAIGAVAIWSIIEVWRDERKLDAKDEKPLAKPMPNSTRVDIDNKWMGDR